MDQSGLHYAAAACVIAGGLLVGGPGVAVALADPGGGGQHDGDGSRHSSDSGGGTRDGKGGAAQGSTASRRGDGPRQGRPGQQPGADQPGQDPGEGQPGQGRYPQDECDQGDGGKGGSGGTGGSTGGGRRNHVRPYPYSVPTPPLQPGLVEPDVVVATAGPVDVPPPEVPVLTAPLVVLPPPAVGASAGRRVELPAPPPGSAPPPSIEPLKMAREPIPGEVGRDISSPESFRAGYSEYLRTAGVTQMAALALPGVTGILLLTAGGGFIGYRQAKAGHTVRTEGIARFLH